MAQGGGLGKMTIKWIQLVINGLINSKPIQVMTNVKPTILACTLCKCRTGMVL